MTPSTLQPAEAKSLVLIEDDQNLRLILVELLEFLGHKVVHHFDSAEAALEVLQRDVPTVDLILTDYSLPGMKAPALLDALRQLQGFNACPMALMTGFLKEDILPEFSTPPEHFLAKPFSVEELTAVLECLP